MCDCEMLKKTEMDCAVCLQKCNFPTQLPCGHVFCFLCVKGVAIQNQKCAMCRAAIPPDYLDHPILLESLDPNLISRNQHEFQWYYEGRNGWWRYDERSNQELETAWSQGAPECGVLVAGAVYTVHFSNMLQTRRADSTRRRRVKRDTTACPAKGIAGIKVTIEDNRVKAKEPEEPLSEILAVEDLEPVPVTPQDHSANEELDNIVESISNLNICPENNAVPVVDQQEEESS